MHVYRMITACPSCSTTQEVWNYLGQIKPVSEIACFNCNTIFESEEFIQAFLELKSDETISAVKIVNDAEIILPVS